MEKQSEKEKNILFFRIYIYIHYIYIYHIYIYIYLNHFAIHLKLIQHYIVNFTLTIIQFKNGKKKNKEISVFIM